METTIESLLIDPPLLTADIPGIGGRIKSAPEDFEVEEIPSYEPSGSGEFLYLWIEKRDMGAEYFQRQIAKRLGISEQDVGTAGLKDRHAVTRQWVSVPASVEDRVRELDSDGLRVLQVSRHTNKLKSGHLQGNRFRILLRDVDPSIDTATILPQTIDRLKECGLPNFFGEQRFGRDHSTLEMGWKMVHGESGIIRNRFARKLSLSAVQSALYNKYLARRMADGLFRTVLNGDVMCKWPKGGMFVAEDVGSEQKRFDNREIVTAGPIFGKKTFKAKGDAAKREEELLQEAGISLNAFAEFGKLTMGTRRHNQVYVDDLKFALEPDGVRLQFTLPSGSYATVLLREIMKTKELNDEEDRAVS